MTNVTPRRLRLLYLCNIFPPGWGGRKEVPVHGYHSDAILWQRVSQLAGLSTVGTLYGTLWKQRHEPRDGHSPGLEHELLLWDRNPALWHRWISWRKLRRYYLEKIQRGEMPDAIVVLNLQPVYNYFVKWLRRQPRRPLIVLFLGDSGGLGEKIPPLRRFRYRFKPMQMLEAESVLLYDAALVSAMGAKQYFEPRGVPWLWFPACYKFEYQPPPPSLNQNGPIRFGYFGALGNSYASTTLVRAFLNAGVPGSLHICGGGAVSDELKQLAGRHQNFHFDGFLPRASDCLDWAQKLDVLINPRITGQGQDNSFPSKILEYGVAGKAILSTRVGGVDEVLGEEGIYFDPENFEASLRQKIREISGMDRSELQRRAGIIRERIVREFSPDKQARRILAFLDGLVKSRPPSGAPERPPV